MPDPDGVYYRPLAPVSQATNLLGMWAQDAVDTIAERWRNAHALKAYRTCGPIIYTEMSRRMTITDASALLGEMAANGISKAVVVAIDPLIPTSDVMQACSRLHGVLLPFGSVDPGAEDYLDKFDALLESPIAGLKFHSDLQCLPIDDPRMYALMDRLSRSAHTNLPVYLHTGNFPIYRPLESPWEGSLPKLVRSFPNVKFVCGHCGWDKPKAALKAALANPNLYLETSWQPPQLIRRLCDKLGPERLIFGSDYPLFSQARALKNVRQALTIEELEWVTHLNAERLLRPINDPIRDMR